MGDYFYLSPYDHKQLKLPFNLTKEYIVKSANFFQKSYMAEIGEGVSPLWSLDNNSKNVLLWKPKFLGWICLFKWVGGDVFDYSGSKFHSESSKSRRFMRGLCMVLEKPPKTTVTRKPFVGALLNMNIGPLSSPPQKTALVYTRFIRFLKNLQFPSGSDAPRMSP